MFPDSLCSPGPWCRSSLVQRAMQGAKGPAVPSAKRGDVLPWPGLPLEL